ncbi:hypothetical protein MMC07_002323 [Pseudocyphellaria aurata]|nr:hypothetical protein [Pseudocyphellaria aurata]
MADRTPTQEDLDIEAALRQDMEDYLARTEGQPAANTTARSEGEPQPEVTPEQAAQIQARPRRTPRPQRGPMAATSSDKGKGKAVADESPVDDVYRQMHATMQADLDRLLAHQAKEWEKKLANTRRLANDEVEEMNDKLVKLDKKCREAFSKGKEEGERDAVKEHAARWRNMGDQTQRDQDKVKKDQDKVKKEEERLDGREKALTNDFKSAVERVNRDGAAYWKKQAEAYAATLEQQLAQRTIDLQAKEADLQSKQAHLETKLAGELLSHQAAMRDSAREYENRERALRRAHRNEIRQLRSEHLGPDPSTAMDADMEELTARLSAFHFHPVADRHPGPADSTPRPRQGLANPEPAVNKEGRQKLARQRLARQKRRNRVIRQPLAGPTAEVSEENGRLQGVIAGLEKEREALKAQVAKKEEEGKREREAAKAQMAQMAKEKEEGESEVHSLRESNRVLALQAEENKLAARSDSNAAKESATQPSTAIRRRRAGSEVFAANRAELAEYFGHVRRLFAEREAALKKEAEESVEGQAGGAAVVVKPEEGEREMDAPLGVPEKANEGFLQPQFPNWKQIVFFLLVLLLLLGLRSVANRQSQNWTPEPEEMIRTAMDWTAMDTPVLWEDAREHLSRGMYRGS